MSDHDTADLRAPGRSIGRYRVLGVLGAGAMGEVLRARDERLARDVAIKRMKSILGGPASVNAARFEAEARALAALTHPGVVQVFDLGVDGDEPYLVMELVDGPSLKDVLRERGPLPVAEVRAAGIQLARALEAAHARGVLHRDVKPANVLLAPGGVWKLADFGVAHLPDSSMTLSGQFLGTPAYAAPEALTVGQFSPASDVFGLAATLYEAATGVPPRGDASLTELLVRSDEPALGPDAPPPPPPLAGPLRAGLAIDPRARPTAAALAEQLAATASAELPAVAPPAPAPTPVPAVVAPAASAAMSVVGLPAPAPAPGHAGRWRALAMVGGLVALVVLVVLAARGGGDDGAAGEAPLPLPSSRATGKPSRTPAPGGAPLAFAAPRDLDDRGAREWRKIADKVHDEKYGEALHKLRELERRHGASPESAALRRWLEDLLAAGLGRPAGD